MRVVISILAFLFPFQLFAQFDNIDNALRHADSVILISHKISSEYNIADPSGEKSIESFLINGQINPALVLSKKILIDKEKLIRILHLEDGTYKYNPATCDQPQNSILIFSKTQLSFIDICFHCRRFHTSNDLEDVVALSNEKFKKLEVLFESLGLFKSD